MLFDDDPIPFHSRKNRPNYHRYRRHRHQNRVNILYDYYKQLQKSHGHKNSLEKPTYVVSDRRSVFFGPLIRPGKYILGIGMWNKLCREYIFYP